MFPTLKNQGRSEERPRPNQHAVELGCALMQLAELLIEFVMAWPRPKAASAMPAPMIARISAYSAAEAPDWSFSMLMKVLMSYSFHSSTRAIQGTSFPPRVDRRSE